jgi:hypothetical protein
MFGVRVARLFAAVTAFACSLTLCASVADASRASDPPLLVLWNRIGDITLGESKARVQAEYGAVGHGYHVIQRYGNRTQGYYVLHRSEVAVTFYANRVGELAFATPYYRTKAGFGVGSTIPLGPCHTTAASRCEHRWRGFIYNVRLKEDPCSCWVKVGNGAQSLAPTAANFFKPWYIVNVHDGRVVWFEFALKYVD